MTIYWAPFLHAYQPPWQDVEILKQIYKECYMPLLSMLERHENVKLTLNIQGCLLDQFAKLNLKESRNKLRHLIENQKVELVGSGKYHPILPLIPPAEVERQIKLTNSTIMQHFSQDKLSGFFPPEMAVSPQLCKIIKKSNFEWMIMDGIANSDEWPHDYVQQSPSGLVTVFRDTYLSNLISFNNIDAQGFVDQLATMFEQFPDEDHYVITAQDAETFGHHIKYYETSFLGKAFSIIEDRSDIKICFISDLLKKFPKKIGKQIKSSSWSTDGGDLAAKVPYPLWMHPLNPIHKYQYRMLRALYRLMEIVEKCALEKGEDSNFSNYYKTARFFYDESLHSCWLWWASMRPMWSPNLIYKGIDLINKTALNAQLALINLKVGEGDQYYSIVIDNGEKLMNALVDQESKGQHLRTYGDF
ncbi:hypothetical protein [Candidatus Lokiarchaeum ossiferum]|uniref:hypothetical protein n=1 Tax=Candidatus Lokiarchaeum ossiferum TaxID=2951803 RepID=UPI00352E5AAE